MKSEDLKIVQGIIDKSVLNVNKNIATAISAAMNFNIKKLGDTPTDMKQLIPKDYLIAQLAFYLLLSGGTLDDGANIAFGTVIGTMLGTSPSQKIGFYGHAPIVRQSNTAGNVTAGGTYGANEQKMLNDCYGVLRNLGILS